jgi:alkylation response protein AidB-like acyl-CoA dehydrogenase
MARAAVPLLLTPEQELIKQVVREFAEKELAPEATAIDREARFPKDHYAKMAPLGLLGMFLPADQGGSGTDTLSFTVAVEEVARGSGTDAALLILQNTVVTHLLSRTVDAAQRDAYLGPSVAGARIGATALTEESGGSSLEDVLTTATERPEGYVLRGSKAFVACAGVADYYIVLARAREGPTLFLVDASAPGLHFSEPESKLGLRGLPLAEMYLNRVAVPASARLGEAGQAMATLEEPLMLARLAVAAGLGGLTQAALESSIDFAKSRVQFGQPIVRFGAIRGFLADLQAELEAARATTYGAAALRDGGKEWAEQAFEARLLAHRIAVRGTRIAHKVHGGAGFMRDLPLERISRDVRTLMHLWDAHDVARSRLATRLLG